MTPRAPSRGQVRSAAALAFRSRQRGFVHRVRMPDAGETPLSAEEQRIAQALALRHTEEGNPWRNS